MCEWATWAPAGRRRVDRADSDEKLLELLLDVSSPTSFDEVRPLLISMASVSRDIVGLPESAAELSDRLLATGAIQKYDRSRREIEGK